MKKKLLSLLFACILIVSALVFAGCKTDELQAQIDENATKAEAAVDEAAKNAADDLAEAKAALEKLIKDGDAADATALADAIAKLEKAIADADTAADSDLAAAKATLEAATKKVADDLTTAKTELETKIAAGDTKALADAIAASNAAIEAADKVLATTLRGEIADAKAALDKAVKAVADDLAAAKTAFNAALDLKADQATLNAKAEELGNAITAATTAAEAANGTLKAELDKTIGELKTNLEKSIADVKAAMELDAKALADAKDALQKEIDALETATGTNLGTAIADAKAEVLKATIKIENWEEATEVVIDYLYELEVEYNAITNTYGDDLSDSVNQKLFAIYNDAKVRLYRAVDKDAADAVWAHVDGMFDAVAYIVDELAAYDYNYYYTDEQDELKAAYTKAMNAIVALGFDAAAEDIEAVETTLAAELDAVLTKAEVIYNVLTSDKTKENAVDIVWNVDGEILVKVAAMIDAESDEVKAEILVDVTAKYEEYAEYYEFLKEMAAQADVLNDRVDALDKDFDDEESGYSETNIRLYTELLADIAAWDEVMKDANDSNKAIVDREAVEALGTKLAAVKAAYEAEIVALKDALESYTGDYVYSYTADGAADINALYDEVLVWAFTTEFKKGFAVDEEVYALFVEFSEGAYVRANEIEGAKAEADAINALIDALTTEIQNMQVIKTEYQTRFNEIDAKVAAWNTKYFADPYAAEAVVGNANYDLLHHADYDALVKLYTDNVLSVIELIEAVEAALAKLETITTHSGADLDAAEDAYLALTKRLGDLQYEIDGLPAPAEITKTLVAKSTEFDAVVAERDALYVRVDELEALEYTDLADATKRAEYEAIVSTLVDDINAFIAKDGADACDCFVGDRTNKLLTAELAIAQAKAVENMTNNMDNYACSEQDALDAILANGVKAVEAVTIEGDFLAALDAIEVSVDAKYAATKAVADSYDKVIVGTPDTAEGDVVKNADAVKATALENILNATEGEAAIAEAAIEDFANIRAVADDYAAALVDVAKVTNADVNADLVKRADASLNAALAKIVAGNDDVALEQAELALVNHTIAQYLANIDRIGEAQAAKAYEYVARLAAEKPMTSADALDTYKTMVTETFAAAEDLA